MDKSKCLGSLALVCAFGWNQALHAADPATAPSCRYGMRFLSATPRQDFREVLPRTGFGLGLFADADLGSGTTAQARFDFIRFPQTSRAGSQNLPGYPAPVPALALLADSAALGMDLRHGIPGLGRVYGLAGVTAIRYEYDVAYAGNKVDQNGIPTPGIIRAKDKTSLKLGLAVGLGVDLWHGLALTGRYTAVDIDGFTFATLETSLSYRF